MNDKVYSSASWDGLVRSVTVAIFTLIASLVITFSIISDILPLTIVLIAVFSCILCLTYLWAPRSYAVKGNSVTVNRLIGDLKINVYEEPKRWKWTWWGVRLLGSGGLYGYFGVFSFKGTGRVWMYATNRHNLVLIKDIKGRKYLLSPDNPEKFIQQLRGTIPRLGGVVNRNMRAIFDRSQENVRR